MSEKVTLECDEDGVATLTLNDAAGNNALSVACVEALLSRFAELSADTAAKVCLIKGSADVFCSGGDKAMLLGLARGEISTTDIMLTRALLEVPIPTIAVMEGHAVGGGLILGLSADMALMARQSRYGCSFLNMGFTPGMGTTRLLAQAVGELIAAEMMYGGQFFRGSYFEGRSAINYILPRAQVAHKAEQLAARIAEKPRVALELLKRSLSLPKRQAFEEARTSESLMHEICFSRREIVEMIEENYQLPARPSTSSS